VDDLLSHVFVCARGDLKSRSISQRYAGLDDDEFTEEEKAVARFEIYPSIFPDLKIKLRDIFSWSYR
jgi:hypothetical protein